MYCWIQSQHIVLHHSRIKNAKYFQNSISDKYNAPGTLDILSDGGTTTYTYLQSPSTQPLLCYTRGWCEDVAIAETICLFGSVSCYSRGSNMRVHRTLYSCDCAVKECHFYVINICSRSALPSYLPTLLHPPPPLHIYSSQPPRTTRNKCNEDTIHSRD